MCPLLDFCLPLHVIGYIDPGAIYEAADQDIVAIQLRNSIQLILVRESLQQYAIDLPAHSAVLPVDHLVDRRAARQRRPPKIAEHLVAEGGRQRAVLNVGAIEVLVYYLALQNEERQFSLSRFSIENC